MTATRRRHPFDVSRWRSQIVLHWRAAALRGHLRWETCSDVQHGILELIECLAGDREYALLGASGYLGRESNGGVVVVPRKDCTELLANLQAAACELEHERTAGVSC